MTVFLRALYGPFGQEEEGSPGHVDHALSWYFFGIREDNTMARWKLAFDLRKRTYRASGLGDCKPFIPRMGHIASGELTHPDAFVFDRPMVHGRNYTELLRARLPPAAIARASALAIRAAP